MNDDSLRLDDVRRRFDVAATTFDAADFVHAHTRDGLLARIAPMTIEAATVIDLGSATGAATRALRKRFRGARIVSVDLSAAMLRQARRNHGWLSRPATVQADACALPFADSSVDVVYSNMLLPWLGDPSVAFGEINRVLRENGLFAFATLGPDSLLALRRAWATVDDGAHVIPFADMHNVGDALVRSGLRDPVLDVDRLSVRYETPEALFRDLTAAGARNSLAGRQRGLTGRAQFAAMAAAMFPTGEPATVGLELVYGHCWGGPARPSDGTIGIDAHRIPVRGR